MKPTSLFINTARGKLVDQAALTAAVADGRIGGVALDVFYEEPLPVDDPLLDLHDLPGDRVTLTPHDAWQSPVDMGARFAGDLVQRVAVAARRAIGVSGLDQRQDVAQGRGGPEALHDDRLREDIDHATDSVWVLPADLRGAGTEFVPHAGVRGGRCGRLHGDGEAGR